MSTHSESQAGLQLMDLPNDLLMCIAERLGEGSPPPTSGNETAKHKKTPRTSLPCTNTQSPTAESALGVVSLSQTCRLFRDICARKKLSFWQTARWRFEIHEHVHYAEGAEQLEERPVIFPIAGWGLPGMMKVLPDSYHHLLTKLELAQSVFNTLASDMYAGLGAAELSPEFPILVSLKHLVLVFQGPQGFGGLSNFDNFFDFFRNSSREGARCILWDSIDKNGGFEGVWKDLIVRHWMPALEDVDVIRLNPVGEVLQDRSFETAVRTAWPFRNYLKHIATVSIPIKKYFRTPSRYSAAGEVQLDKMDEWLTKHDQYHLGIIRAWITERDNAVAAAKGPDT